MQVITVRTKLHLFSGLGWRNNGHKNNYFNTDGSILYLLFCQKRQGIETDLVTTGIYSVSRNPAFLGFDLMYIGILFSFFNWYLCLATGFVLVFFHLHIVNVEEDFLIETFGQEYIEYKKKVCRYLGRKI